MRADVVVLLSIGRHPVSGRSRIPPADAAALELALRLTPSPVALHVGSANDPALRDYLGMGLASMTVIEGPESDDDIYPVLLEHIRGLDPRVVITGERTERGEASGMLPYLLAKALGRPLLPQSISLAFDREKVVAVRQLAGGRRHRIAATGAAIASVPSTGVVPRFPAFGPARRGQMEIIKAAALPDRERQGWPLAPSRPRPPRLRPGAASQSAGTKAPLTGLSPRAAAEEIYSFLATHGLLRE